MAKHYSSDTDRKALRTEKKRDKLRRRRQRSTSAKSARSEGERRPGTRRLRLKFLLILLLLAGAIAGGFRLAAFINSGTDIRLTDKGYTHDSRFSDCIAVNGIDVSEHQGEDINWEKVKTSGADFAFIRAGYRAAGDGSLCTDSCFADNIKNASEAGLMTGAYFYSQALTPEEATEEADYLLKLVSGHRIDLPLVIDFEIYPKGRLEKKIKAGELYAASLYHDIVSAFCRRVEDKGYESAVYANTDMLTHYMDHSLLSKTENIWMAQYAAEAEAGISYGIWQCSQNAAVGGIKGDVDHDFWYIRPGTFYKTKAVGRSRKRVSVSECRVVFSEESFALKMRRATPKFRVAYKGGNLRRGADYEYSVIRNTASGTGYVILRGTGRYKDWLAIPFNIE